MKTKLRKIMYTAATVLFIGGLAINVYMTLDDPCENVSSLVLAEKTDTGTGDNEEGPWNCSKNQTPVKRTRDAYEITQTLFFNNDRKLDVEDCVVKDCFSSKKAGTCTFYECIDKGTS